MARRSHRLSSSPGELLAGVASIALLASLFVPWFHQESSGGLTGRGNPNVQAGAISAWDAFGILAVPLAVTAAIPLALVAGRRRGRRREFPAVLVISAGAAAAALGAVASLLFFAKADPFTGPDDFYMVTTLRFGLFIGESAASAIAVGGLLEGWSRLQRSRRSLSSVSPDSVSSAPPTG